MSEREEFEKWFKGKGGKMEIPAAPLPDLIKAIAWEAWQAARATDAEEVGDIFDIDGHHFINMDYETLRNLPVGTKLYTNSPAKPESQIPEGQVMMPKEFLEEYLELLDGAEYKEIHKLVRRNAVENLLANAPTNQESGK